MAQKTKEQLDQEEADRKAAETAGGRSAVPATGVVAPQFPSSGPPVDKPPGVYIRGGKPGPDRKHYGGQVVNYDGEVLATFKDNQVNTGNPADGSKPG